MPESPETKGKSRQIEEGTGSGLASEVYQSLEWYFCIIPITHATGTAEHAYQTLMVAGTPPPTNTMVSEASQPCWMKEQIKEFHALAEHWDYDRESTWAYLMDLSATIPGKLTCSVRGKLMMLSAGQHAVTASLALEAHWLGMKPALFFELVRDDVAGPNNDPDRAEIMRTFRIPEDYIVEGSSHICPRTIRIVAAFVSSSWVHVLCDFSGLVWLRVESKAKMWAPEELEVGSHTWRRLFESFKGGPDWFHETPVAKLNLKEWRNSVLEEHETYLLKVSEVMAHHKKLLSNHTISSFFPLDIENASKTTKERIASGQTPFPVTPLIPPPKLPVQKLRPIIKEMCNNSLGAFSGFGRHTANDFLHEMALFPGTPSHVVCTNEDLFQELEVRIISYIAQFSSDEFFERVTSRGVNENPFSFDESANRQYMTHYIHVFRRAYAKISKPLYEFYCKQGLLDPDHTIGEPYPPEKAQACIAAKFIKPTQKHAFVPVFFHKKPLRAFSIITARPPSAWGMTIEMLQVKKDIAAFGYATTIGLVQFREHVLNRVDPERLTYKPKGRRTKTLANGRGRPSKSETKKTIQRKRKLMRGRNFSNQSDNDEEIEDEDQEEQMREIMNERHAYTYDDDGAEFDDEDDESEDAHGCSTLLDQRFQQRCDLDIQCPTISDHRRLAKQHEHRNHRFEVQTDRCQTVLVPTSETIIEETTDINGRRSKTSWTTPFSRLSAPPLKTGPDNLVTPKNRVTGPASDDFDVIAAHRRRVELGIPWRVPKTPPSAESQHPKRVRLLTFGAYKRQQFNSVEELERAAWKLIKHPYSKYEIDARRNPMDQLRGRPIDHKYRAPAELLTYDRAFWLMAEGTQKDKALFLKGGWQGKDVDVSYRKPETVRAKQRPILARKYGFKIVPPENN